MRKAVQHKWASLSRYSSSSSRTTTTRAPSSAEGSYEYYSSGSGSYSSSYTSDKSHTSSTAASSTSGHFRASSADVASDAASTFSAASGSGSSGTSAASSSSSHPVADSLVSNSNALGAAATSLPKDKSKLEKAAPAASKVVRLSSFATTSNGMTVDDSDALVPASSSSIASSGQSAFDSSSARGLTLRVGGPHNSTEARPHDDAVVSLQGSHSVDTAGGPASPYHFSEEELARQPWPVDCDATTHTSEEGGVLITRAADALATIHTVPIDVPPPLEEVQRRRRGGGLPYPSHLTFRIVAGAAAQSSGNADGSNADDVAAAAARKAKEGKKRLDDDSTKDGIVGRAKKAVCDACFGGHFRKKREEGQRSAEERAAARQKSYHNQLRSHHVPLVNFRTTRDPHANLLDGDNTLPTVEEAAGYRQCVEDLTGAEAQPKKLEKAMRQRRRPASGLHWKTNYAYGRRAGGGPRGVGESAFAREGDPQRFWIAQLHERSQVHLEPIETE